MLIQPVVLAVPVAVVAVILAAAVQATLLTLLHRKAVMVDLELDKVPPYTATTAVAVAVHRLLGQMLLIQVLRP